MEPGSHATSGSREDQSKSKVEVYLNPENIILRPVETGLFPPCPGPACPGAHSLTPPTSANPKVAL